MDKKKKGLVLSILGIIGLIIITTGVTYAFFNYVKEGTTENSITTGTITFLYTETSSVGRGISIDDAYPISDEVGKAQTGEGKVFDFKVTSTTPNNSSIPYEITARKKSDSTLEEKAVKLYLTKVTGDVEEEVLLANYNTLTQTAKIDSSKYTEKTIYTGKVPADSTNYEQNFRLRMWIDNEVDFSPVKDEEGNDQYPYNDKEFTITVNVYANAKVVTEKDIENETKAEISTLIVGDSELTKVENKEYDYEASLPEGTTSTIINVETISPYATVNIERIDSLAYKESNVKRLSTKKTLDLLPGDNYFKITVISENNEIENEYKLKISVEKQLEKVTIFNQTFEVIDSAPTLTTTSVEAGDINGLYKSTDTNSGDPTYYFRGNVENYVDFAGFTWRVVRINEDGTIRIIMQEGINNNKTYKINSNYDNKMHMYYSNSNIAKPILESWYTTNIINKGYSDRVAAGDYYCEQAKVARDDSFVANSGANMIVYPKYIPNFKCEADANGKGIVNANIGLLTYDEVVHAGAYYNKYNESYYLYGLCEWTMSPAGFPGSARGWVANQNRGELYVRYVDGIYVLRPVINLKKDIKVTGTGTSGDHWVVQ